MAGKRINALDPVTALTLDDRFALDQELASSNFKTYQATLGEIRDKVLGGDERMLLLENGDDLLLEDSDTFLLEGSGPPVPVSVVSPIETVSSDQAFNEVKYYRVTGGTTFTVTTAITVFSSAVPFVMEIKNVSGSTITVNRTGTDTFYTTSSGQTTFNITNGQLCRLIAATTSVWDVNITS